MDLRNGRRARSTSTWLWMPDGDVYIPEGVNIDIEPSSLLKGRQFQSHEVPFADITSLRYSNKYRDNIETSFHSNQYTRVLGVEDLRKEESDDIEKNCRGKKMGHYDLRRRAR